MGECQRSLEINDVAWRLAREAQSLQGFLLNTPHVGLALAGLGRYDEAIDHLEWSLGQARDLELVPRFTSRCAGMLAGVLHDFGDTERARELSLETIELSALGGFPPSGIFARLDLLVADTEDGDLGRAQVGWDALWKETQNLRGWHEWLGRGRLLQVRSDLLLATGAGDEATEAAIAAVTFWIGYQRPKYVALGLATLGSAHLCCGRPAEAVAELRRAETVARHLGHPTTTWHVLAALVPALAAVGDDDAATATAAELQADIEAFAARLSPARRDRFLAGRSQ
jgi:tetratricopeptide (TPR) repeat protein